MEIIDKLIDRLADRVAEKIENRNTINIDGIKLMDPKDSEKLINYRLGEKTDRFEKIRDSKHHNNHRDMKITTGTLKTNNS